MKYGSSLSTKEEAAVEHLKKHGVAKTLSKYDIKLDTLRTYKKRYNKYMSNNGRSNECYNGKLTKIDLMVEREIQANTKEDTVVANSKHEFTEDISKGEAHLTFITAKLPTSHEEIAVEYHVDLLMWEPCYMKTNTWQVTNKDGDCYDNHQVDVRYQIRKNLNYREIFSKLSEQFVPNFSQFTLHKKVNASNDKCAIINLYDAHIDKISIKAETGEDSSLADNVARFNNAFDDLVIGVQKENPELIIYPIGNDLYHTNNFNGTTKKGTNLQYFTNPEDSYAIISDMVIDSIKKLLKFTNANIQIYFLAGNHDCDNITILSYWINKMFADHPRVELGSNRKKRKYHTYGSNLFMFAHGDKEKRKIHDMPLLMAEEGGVDFALAKNKKIFLGDIHHEQEYKFLKSKDRPGVEMTFLRSIGCSDRYHQENGWIGIPKSAYAEIWAKDGSENITRRINF